MSIEQGRSWIGSPPQVTKRLCATIMFFIGAICVFAGYLLGNMSRCEAKRNNLVTLNLTTAAETLYKKAKKISPKTIYHNDSDRVTATLLNIFHCNVTECGTINKLNLGYNLPEFVKKAINIEVNKLMRAIYNATVYLDSLR